MYIVGDLSGLLALRKALETALSNYAGMEEVFAGDGEGFQVVVARLDSSTDWDRMRLPYPLEGVPERRDAIDPWELPQVKKVQPA